jgi:putative sigma-54 modulation protein
MDIRVLGKHIAVTEGMKEHLREKLMKFERYAPRLVESHVVLKKEKYLFTAEITLLAKNLRAYGEASSKENVFTAIDQAYLRVEKQLKKYREKVKDHHKHRTAGAKIAALIPDDLPEAAGESRKSRKQETAAPKIIRSSRPFVAARPLFPEDAGSQLRETQQSFLVFQNASNQKVNIIFKREDGQYGLIEPNF